MTDILLSTSPNGDTESLWNNNLPISCKHHLLPALQLNTITTDKKTAVHLPNLTNGQPHGNGFFQRKLLIPIRGHTENEEGRGEGGGTGVVGINYFSSGSDIKDIGTSDDLPDAFPLKDKTLLISENDIVPSTITTATTTTSTSANRPSLSQCLPTKKCLRNRKCLQALLRKCTKNCRCPQESDRISETSKSLYSVNDILDSTPSSKCSMDIRNMAQSVCDECEKSGGGGEGEDGGGEDDGGGRGSGDGEVTGGDIGDGDDGGSGSGGVCGGGGRSCGSGRDSRECRCWLWCTRWNRSIQLWISEKSSKLIVNGQGINI